MPVIAVKDCHYFNGWEVTVLENVLLFVTVLPQGRPSAHVNSKHEERLLLSRSLSKKRSQTTPVPRKCLMAPADALKRRGPGERA